MLQEKSMILKKDKTMNEIQRTAIKGSNRTRGTTPVKYTQLNVRISANTMLKLRRISKASGKSQAWIVEHAILQSLDFND